MFIGFLHNFVHGFEYLSNFRYFCMFFTSTLSQITKSFKF